MNDVNQFVSAASKLPGRPTNAPKGLMNGKPLHPGGRAAKPVKIPTAPPGAPAPDPQAEIAALQERVAALEAQLETLLQALSVAPGGNVTLSSPGRIELQGSVIALSAGLISLESGMVNADGVVKCDTMISNAVVSSSYTPGAGNIW